MTQHTPSDAMIAAGARAVSERGTAADWNNATKISCDVLQAALAVEAAKDALQAHPAPDDGWLPIESAPDGGDGLERPIAAIEHLTNHQQQADFEGIMVTVSRQALDELLLYEAALTALRASGPGELEIIEKCAQASEDQADHSSDASCEYDSGAGSSGYEQGCFAVARRIRALKALSQEGGS